MLVGWLVYWLLGSCVSASWLVGTLHRIAPHHTTQHHTTPHSTAPRSTTPHYTTPHHITLHHTTQHATWMFVRLKYATKVQSRLRLPVRLRSISFMRKRRKGANVNCDTVRHPFLKAYSNPRRANWHTSLDCHEKNIGDKMGQQMPLWHF